HDDNSPFLFGYNEVTNIRSVSGKVTHVFHGHGLIDKDIYFSKADLPTDVKLEVGDEVLVKAVQYSQDGGWYAESVTVISQTWENEEKIDEGIDVNILRDKVVLGKVTSFQGRSGKINDTIDFNVESCKDGFVPMKGDWVSAYIQMDAVEENGVKDEWDSSPSLIGKKALGIRPTRQFDIEGTVTALRDNHGYVNEEIFFDKSVCVNGFWPRKNAPVKVIAIESSVGRRCEKRAISLVPLSASNKYSTKANENQKSMSQINDKWYFPGQRPKRFQPPVQLPVKLPQYSVPEKVYSAVVEGEELTSTFPCLSQELSFQNYVSRMSTLLYFEEIQMHLDIQEFNMTRVVLHPAGEYLALTVPGLAEGRPSLLVGDKIILTPPSDPDGPRYEGFIHEMTSTDVLLKFYPEFHSRYNGEDFNVEFTFRRIPIRRSHQAVSLAVQHLTSNVLFPNQVDLKKPQVKVDEIAYSVKPDETQTTFKSQDIRNQKPSYSENRKTLCYFNKLLNDRQKTAVRKILLGQCRPTPYIIFGPPGTGKTITVVEAILQIYTHIPSSRIVVCTPSNSAADLIMERLHLSNVLEPTQIVRLNSHQRSLENIPESILKYCQFGDDLDMISRYRVIVSTCIMAGGMYGLGIRSGHFTHIFVDESGQATEPECLTPIGLIAGNLNGQIVLAGDPKQLGPIIMSPYAKMYGLELSLLERLMNRDVYQRDEDSAEEHEGFDPNLVTMLIYNYRSHPGILDLPSRLFYYSQLQPLADPALTHRLSQWKELPKSGFPVIFHGLRGLDLRETNSPSWFNPGEIMQVIIYLQGVLKENIKPEDIGVITPYKKQVEKIRFMIDNLGLPEIKVGSVEEFQGQEQQVIILSCVRSNEKLIGADIRHSLGFLCNPKRLNVSITRAISLLIIVGNPYVLVQDHHWNQLIQYCKENGGYIESTQTKNE
ncbi:helicase Mov10l1, partial [Biomphalaria glabrata]